MQKPRLFAASLGVVALTLLPSCQDEDFGYTAEQIKYAKSFTEKYGEIAPDKNWDLSTYGIHYGDDAGAGTRGAGQLGDKLSGYYDNEVAEADKQFVKKGWWEVPKNTLTWMEKALAEGKDNRYLGSNFILQLPANDFAIVPIFQGHSGINSELEVKINGYKITKVWGRSEDILVNDRTMTESQAASLPGASAITQSDIKTTNNTYNTSTGKYEADNKWHTLGYYTGVTNPSHADQESNGRGVEYNDGISDYVYPTYPCYMEWAHRVMSKPIYFRKDKISSGNPYMYLSLHNIGKQIIKHDNGVELMWDYNIWLDDRGPNVWTTVGNRLTSINPAKRMLALNIPTASRPNKDALPKIHEGQGNDYREPSQVMIIACEDADGVASDNDVNDVAFLIIGYPNVPTVIPTEEVIKKRYMCEDLGATDDFDFNDIVVDVTQKMQYQLVTSPAGMEDYNFNEGLNNDDVTGVEIASMQPMPETRVQTAKITHVCGTLPIQVKVGNYMFPKIDDPTDQYGTRNALKADGHLVTGTKATRASGEKTGWNPNEEKVITDNSWDPAANNITIYVDWSKSDCPKNQHSVNFGKVDNTNNPYNSESPYFADFAQGNKMWVAFPRPGDVPYIIATDQDVPWMRERQDIPQAWVDSRADITARNGNEADPGYGMYMENYNGGNGTRQEVAIWTGSVTGMAGTTGVVLEPGSAEVLGIAAAGDGYTDPDELATGTNQIERHLYKILKVYTEPMSNGQKGAVGLCYVDENGKWVPLTTQQPDAYYQGAVENSGYGYGVEGLCCTEIFLTDEQYNIIVGNSGRTGKGLVVTSQTDRLVIRKIAMDRDMSGGFIVNIDKTTNGTIKAIGQRERIVDSKADAGDEASRCSIPYDQARYKTGSTFTLTAIGKKGWALKNWYVNNVALSETEAEHVFTCTDGTDARTRNIRVEFEEALDPGLYFRPYPYDQWKTSIDLRIANGSTFKQRLSSYTWNKIISTYGHDANIVSLETPDNENIDENWYHFLNITGNSVGTTEFVVYMKDCRMGDKRYGVSEELKAKIQVVDVPTADIALDENKFYEWNILAGGAHITGTGEDCNKLGQEVTPSDGICATVLGNTYNKDIQYADLNGSDYMVINVAYGYAGPRLFFNKSSVASIDFLVSDPNCPYTSYVNCDDGSISYIVDLKAVRGASNNKAAGWYCSVLNCVTSDWQQSTKVNWIKLDKYNSDAVDDWESNHSNKTLTLKLDDADFTLYINGTATKSAGVMPGSTVKVKAVRKENGANTHYMWTGVNGIADSNDNVETSFTMPVVDTEIMVTPLYEMKPQTKIFAENGQHTPKYDNSLGTVSLSWNGRNTYNTDAIYVPAGAEVTGSATEKPGYAFKKWFNPDGTDKNSVKATRDSKSTVIDYKPQALYVAAAVTDNNGVEMGNYRNFTLTNYKPAETWQNGLGLKFNNSVVTSIKLRYAPAGNDGSWQVLRQTDVPVVNGYVVIRFTTDEINTLKNANTGTFFIEVYPTDLQKGDTQIESVYKFVL